MFFSHILSLRDLKYLAIGLVIVFSIFILMRVFNILRKRSCPSCTGRLTRKQRTIGDKIVKYSTFNILPFRRYKCVHCGWEGLRWNVRKEQRKKPRD